MPTLESLRFLNPTQLRARVAGMLERRGYQLLTPETADDLLAIKDGEKCVVAFASTSDPAPVQANHMIELHRVVTDTNAAKGFYVTTRADFHATPKPTPKPPRSSWSTGRSWSPRSNGAWRACRRPTATGP